MYVTFTITEFSEIKLLETPEITEYSISDYDEKSGTIAVSCVASGEYTVIFADYDGNLLNKAETTGQKLSADKNMVSIPDGITLGSGDKIFLWNMKDLSPLCKEYIIK